MTEVVTAVEDDEDDMVVEPMPYPEAPFKEGDWIVVPAGTPEVNNWKTQAQQPLDKSKREVMVQVSGTGLNGAWTEKLSKLEQQSYQDEIQLNHSKIQEIMAPWYAQRHGRPWDDAMETLWHEYQAKTEPYNQEARRIHDEWERKAASRFTADDYIVYWSKNGKNALAKDVRAADPAKVKTKVDKKKANPPKVNYRQKMIPKSKWRITEDRDIFYQGPNPAVKAGLRAWNTANPEPQPRYQMQQITRGGHTYQHQVENPAWRVWLNAQHVEERRLENTLGKYVPELYCSLKKDDILEITGKFTSYWGPSWYHERVNNVARCKVVGTKDQLYIPYKQIADIVAEEEIPVQKTFVIRNKDTGKFFAYSSRKYDYRTRTYADEFTVDVTDNFMGGKQFADIGKAKTGILLMTGYFKGLPGADSLPEWMNADEEASFEMLEAYELVEFDKLARQELATHDLWAWYQQTWKLRELTMKYGSSVRRVYGELERKNLLDTQNGMVVFTVTDEDKLDNVGYWGNRSALSEADKEEIEKAIASANLKKNSYRKASDHKSVAVSFANKSAALMFKLAYTGDLKLSILDLKEMTEVVETQEAKVD